MIAAARSVSSDEATARTALRLGPRSVDERFRNLALDAAPCLPAVERYTGVLYDALEAPRASDAERAWLAAHVVVQSAMFGPVGGGDPIPAYRLSHDARLPGVRLPALWSAPSERALVARTAGGFVLDLRSEGYRALGPVPGAVAPRVVSEGADGRRRALNHWNKTAKGRLVAALARSGAEPATMDELVAWAADVGVVLERSPGGWDLVAESLESVRG